ncbi:MAG: hypothetical protein K2I76_02440 [Malacoplasma sp.]|nr:hypothetical protein [Malacoplasma sp.]
MKTQIQKNIDNIYAKKNIWKLSLKTVVPSLLLTLLFGIYIFVDQMLIVNLVPQDGHNYIEIFFKNNNELELYQKVSSYINENPGINLSVSNSVNDFIAFPTSNLIGPFSLIVLSFGYLISAGGAVLFSKYLSINNEELQKKIIWNSFYASLIFGLIATVIMILIQNPLLKSMVPSSNNLEVNGNNTTGITESDLKRYFNTYYLGVVDQANQYIYWINAGILFSCLNNLLVFYLRAEGKNLWVTLFGVFSNILNIVFDIILICVIKIGIMGGGIATFIGQAINLVSLISYLIYLNIKNLTIIRLSILKINKNLFDLKMIWTSVVLGSSTFLRELSLAIANIIYVPVFMKTMGAIDVVALASFGKVVASPIYNLFFFSIFGIIDGMRPIISYNYSQKNYHRVKQGYWIGLLTAIVYSFIVISFSFSIIPYNNQLLKSLNAITDFDKQNLFILFLSMMWQFPFISLSIGGLALFQSTNKKIANVVLSLMQGTITFYPILFIMSSIAQSSQNVNIMVFTGFTNIAISSLIIFICSLLFIKFLESDKVWLSFKTSLVNKFKNNNKKNNN